MHGTQGRQEFPAQRSKVEQATAQATKCSPQDPKRRKPSLSARLHTLQKSIGALIFVVTLDMENALI